MVLDRVPDERHAHGHRDGAAHDTYTINPDTGLRTGETLRRHRFRRAVSATRDAIDPPDHMAADRTFSFTVAAPAKPTFIHDVQGTTDTSPKVGQTVTVEGVVVGDFQGAGQFSGFYLQEEDADVDADPATSRASSSSAPRGEHRRRVRVDGTVSEFTA